MTSLSDSPSDLKARNPNIVIQVYDSDNCLPKRLLSFNLSGSPFVAAAYHNYTFLSCPTQIVESRLTTIDCLSNSTTSVLATASISIADSLSTSCRIIITLPIPVSWPFQYGEEFSSALQDDLRLTWPQQTRPQANQTSDTATVSHNLPFLWWDWMKRPLNPMKRWSSEKACDCPQGPIITHVPYAYQSTVARRHLDAYQHATIGST
ncbi:hypothetical protein GH714_020948 [Hevea brasiliensis]|uniref:RING-type E3 ubiquitin transferase n=1 Tax=Hevea brasiliensis TaxID=3981 RepID=A0A6A6NI89_HEVBR|nr:hypothetical protein GH714_020948 [Hevea brasiliensis]